MSKQAIIILVAVALVVLGVAAYFVLQKPEAVEPAPIVEGGGAAEEGPVSLGEEIYEQTQSNPVGDLQGANPTENLNPIEGVYRNPFE